MIGFNKNNCLGQRMKKEEKTEKKKRRKKRSRDERKEEYNTKLMQLLNIITFPFGINKSINECFCFL